MTHGARLPEAVLRRAATVRLLVVAVEGVLTDGGLIYTDAGERAARIDAADARGIAMLAAEGVSVVLVSPRPSSPVASFAEEKGLRLEVGCAELGETVATLRDELALEDEQIALAIADAADVPAADGLGLSLAPDGAAAAGACDWVTPMSGGHGAVREIADLIGKARSRERERASAAEARFGVIIPARYAATRLPGKALRPLAGRPMIAHVLDNARRAAPTFTWVATDDERIAKVVERHDGEAVLTSPDHPSGTDRIAEVVREKKLEDDAVVVNVQGDEPLLDPELIVRVARDLHAHPTAGVATLVTPIRDPEQVLDPNVVKALVNRSGMAVAFSRAPVPWIRDVFGRGEVFGRGMPELDDGPTFLRHVGLYAYRAWALREIAAHPPVALERAESLEQLRMLWLGIPIHVTEIDEVPAHGVDTEVDVAAVEHLLRERETKAGVPRSEGGLPAGVEGEP